MQCVQAALVRDVAELTILTTTIVAGIAGIISMFDHEKEEAFTKSLVSQARRQWLDANALCFHDHYTMTNFVEEAHYRVELNLDAAGVRTQGIECLV